MGSLGFPGGWSGSHGTRGGWAQGSTCLHLPGRNTGRKVQANDPARAKRLSQHPGWGLAGNAGDARLGGEPRPLAGSHCPVPAHPLRMPQEGGGRPSAEIIGCLPGRGSCHPAGGSAGSTRKRDQGLQPCSHWSAGDDFQMWPLARRRWLLQAGKHQTALPGPLLGS